MAETTVAPRDCSGEIRQLPFTGLDISVEVATQTPDTNVGSFLIDPKTRSQAIFTPSDMETGVCFPIVTSRSLPKVGVSLQGGEVVADWNHNYHPKEFLIHGTKVQKALRDSRIEWVDRRAHVRYHDEFYGPDIMGLGDLLGTLVFVAAGYIPAYGMQYDDSPKAKIVALDEQTRLNLWVSGRIKIANKISVRDALTERAIAKDFGGIKESTIDEFLATKNRDRRFQLGSTLLALAVYDMSNPLSPTYKTARERHLLPPNSSPSVGRCVMRLISPHNRGYAISALERRLAAA